MANWESQRLPPHRSSFLGFDACRDVVKCRIQSATCAHFGFDLPANAEMSASRPPMVLSRIPLCHNFAHLSGMGSTGVSAKPTAGVGRYTLLCAAVLALALVPSAVQSQTNSPSKPPAKPNSPVSGSSTPTPPHGSATTNEARDSNAGSATVRLIPGLNDYASTFVQLGALSCAARIHQVTSFLAVPGEVQAAGTLQQIPAPADRRLLTLSLSLQPTKGQPAYASAWFAPNQAGGCESSYETVVYWPKGCPEVARTEFSNTGMAPDVGVLSVRVIGARARVFLLPAGSGCVSIKKELVTE